MKTLDVNQMENVQGGSCWLATAALVAAGICFTATAGAGAIITGLALAGLFHTTYGYIQECYPELFE